MKFYGTNFLLLSQLNSRYCVGSIHVIVSVQLVTAVASPESIKFDLIYWRNVIWFSQLILFYLIALLTESGFVSF